MMLLFDTINIMASESLGGMRMKYSIAICDDSKTDAALVQSFLLEWAKQRGTEVEIEVFPSAESFLFRYDEYKAFDILLFDVEMSGMDGVSAARKVRRENEAVQIVFITGYSDYIAEGYDVAALHYLMKPLNKEKFFSVEGIDRSAVCCVPVISASDVSGAVAFLETSPNTHATEIQKSLITASAQFLGKQIES